MYAIICDARKGGNLGIETLALVDRGKTKKFWWTSDNPGLILGYRKKPAAEFALSRLKKNNPRIIPLEEAKAIISFQKKAIIDNRAHLEDEREWDAHKFN